MIGKWQKNDAILAKYLLNTANFMELTLFSISDIELRSSTVGIQG